MTHIFGRAHKKVFQTISYPSYFNTDLDHKSRNNTKLTYISVIDLNQNNTGGYPRLISGGIGHKHVVIKLFSQIGHGLDFNITLYGK